MKNKIKRILSIYFISMLCVVFSFLHAQQNVYQHFIMYGQSLSTGHQSYPVISDENIKGNYMIGDQIWINHRNSKNRDNFTPLVGTIAANYKDKANIMNRAAGTIAECPLLGAVNHIQLKTALGNLIATSCGTGGRSIEDLSKESKKSVLYYDFISALSEANLIAEKNNVKLNCPAVFWMQGEWNYLGKGGGLNAESRPVFEKNEYKTLLVKLKNNMQFEVIIKYSQPTKPIFFTYQTGAQYTKGRYLTIGMAQLEAANENADIVCAGPVYQMTDRGGHLDSNGYRWYGEMLGKVYYKTQVLKSKFIPLQPLEISRTSDPKTIKIKFFVPEPPLVLDTQTISKVKDFGFEVYKDSVKQKITDIKIDGECVYITCSKKINHSSTIDILYAGEDVKGNGNLRDSDDYEAFYNYIDLDKKNDNNCYVYPRDSDEITLRPSSEPKDKNGEVIYDKKYPLYNFSVAFSYRIKKQAQKYIVPNI